MVTEKDKRNIEEYLEKIGMDKQPTIEDLKKAVIGAIKNRAQIFYFTWKTIQELHPEIDADEIMKEASIKFGEFLGSKYKNVNTAKDAMTQLSSKAGALAFDQKFLELNEEKSVKKFYYCPHLEAFKELGCSEKEMKKLCLDMLNQGDFARFYNHKNVKISFLQYLSRGEECCEMTFETLK